MKTIGILGFGSVGQRLAGLFSEAGYDVRIGLRGGAAKQCSYLMGGIEETALAADALGLAIPYTACAGALPSLSRALAGKIVIDNTNPLNADWSPLSLGENNSAGEEIARMLPDSRVVKAFNTIFADVMHPDRMLRDGQRITAFLCGDDAEAKGKVIQLATDCGFAPLDCGPLRVARFLEAMAHLNIQIAVGQGGGTNAAFLYHQVRS